MGSLLIVFSVVVGGGAAIAYFFDRRPQKPLQKKTSVTQLSTQVNKDFELNYKEFERLILEENGLYKFDSNPYLPSQYKEIFEYFNPKNGFIANWLAESKTEKLEKISSKLNAIQQNLFNTVTRAGNEVLQHRKTAGEFYIYMQQNFQGLKQIQQQIQQVEQNMQFNQVALGNQMLPEHYSLANLESVQTDNRIKEHKEKTKIDLDRLLDEKREAVRLSLISKHLSDIQKVKLVQGQIDDVYHEINEIENGRITTGNNLQLSEWIKDSMIKDRKEIIDDWKETRRAIQRRLREAHIGADTEGVDENTDIR
jgi:hypothetical protein